MQDKREFKQVTVEQRWKLHELRRQGHSMRECGRRLGVNVSTVSRELANKSAEVAGGRVYLPDHAMLVTKGRRARCPMKCLGFQTPNEVYSQCCIQN
jgi:IS30 family transposase